MAHFAARTDSGYQAIYFQDVEYLEAQNKNVLVTLKDGSVISIKEPFHQCETIFTEEKGFYKCHRSYIAALSWWKSSVKPLSSQNPAHRFRSQETITLILRMFIFPICFRRNDPAIGSRRTQASCPR